MNTRLLFAAAAAVALVGCSKANDYTPKSGASGEEIFAAACASCHEAQAGYIFEMAADSATKDALSKKVAEGSMVMPSFPNIKGAELDALVGYVQSQNKAQ